MIKGRYVAQIEVDFSYDGEKTEYQLLHDRLHSEWINRAITATINGVFKGGNPIVTVTKQFAECTELEEEIELKPCPFCGGTAKIFRGE